MNIFSLYIYIVKQNKQKSSRILEKMFVDFQNLMKIYFCWRLIFEILIIHKPPLWARSEHTCRCLFDTYIQTDRDKVW